MNETMSVLFKEASNLEQEWKKKKPLQADIEIRLNRILRLAGEALGEIWTREAAR